MHALKVTLTTIITFFISWLVLDFIMGGIGYILSPELTFKAAFQLPAPIMLGFIVGVVIAVMAGCAMDEHLST